MLGMHSGRSQRHGWPLLVILRSSGGEGDHRLVSVQEMFERGRPPHRQFGLGR